MSTPLLLGALSAAATLLLLGAEWREWRAGIWLFKPCASALFVAAGAAGADLSDGMQRLVVAGLVLGALGDLLLIPHHAGAFLAGLGVFLLGHVAYAVGFAVRGVDGLVTAVAAALLGAVALPVARWLLPNVKRSMQAPVIAYMVVISAMVALAVGLAWRTGQWRWLAAACAFYASDLSVARDRFVKREFLNRAWGLPAYYGAQIAFALSL